MEKIEEFYENKNLAFAYAKWDYGDRERYCKLQRDKYWMEESYTSLAAEYNREMARSNWRFATVGGLPKGTDEPLPREFNLYAYNTQ